MKKVFLLWSLFVLTFCSETNMGRLYTHWVGREIVFPQNVYPTRLVSDTIWDFPLTDFKILNYIDSIGCLSCKSQLPLWDSLISDFSFLSSANVSVIINMHPKDIHDAKYAVRKNSFTHPVFVDLNDSLNKLNHFPSDPRFHCFLLDENNKVILIGNPVQNPKIKELYLRTICERLGIEYNQNSDAKKDNKNEINLGSFPKSESKSVQFFIPNNTESEMQIDTVFSSCECTTAKIDKISISPHQNASLSVTYTPDGSGEFFREVYVKVRGDDKLKTFAIRGNVE